MTPTDLNIMARTLYGEARGEYTQNGLGPLIAVANVIVNRFRAQGRFGNTISEVCMKPKQFSCWNEGDLNLSVIQNSKLANEPLFQTSERVALRVAQGFWPDLTRGSDHYHHHTLSPSWARKGQIKLRLGNHIFYKLS